MSDLIENIVEKRVKQKMEEVGIDRVELTNEVHQEMKDKTKEDIENDKIALGKSYEKIIEILKYYIDVKDEYYKILALWIIGTYFHSAFPTFPFLFLHAMRGSGKTRTLKLVAHLSFGGDGQVQTGVTESVLFRSKQGATLIWDEVESIGSREKSTFREYLNAAYKRGGVVSRSRKVKKQEGETFEIEKFEPYRPIAMANIWGMEEVLGDRCMTLILEKSASKNVTMVIEDFESNQDILEVKRTLGQIQCSLCGVVNTKNYIQGWNNYIKSLFPNTLTTYTTYNINNYNNIHIDIKEEEFFRKIIETGINGRDLELFFPLIIIGGFINDSVGIEALKICGDISSIKKTDEFAESKDVSLIEFISRQENLRFEYTPVKNLTMLFRQFLGDADDEDKWLNAKWVGRALKRLNLVGQKRRVAQGIEVILNVDKAKEKIVIFKDIKEVQNEGNKDTDKDQG